MKKITVFGAGGFGREVKMLIDQINRQNTQYEFIGFYDDGIEKGTLVNGHEVLGGLADLEKIDQPTGLVFAIANPLVKRKLLSAVKNPHISFPTLVHPNALIGEDAVTIGEGCIICAGCIITVNINIGKHVILNLACTVGHDTTVGDFSSFMPSVNISGEVNIASCVYAGTGAKIINQSNIGEETIIGMGAVVSKSLPAKCTAVGVPAKPVKFHD
jgi:sugar O-acyltransferase (sialic acid O-acetyltransferase NeuD family)